MVKTGHWIHSSIQPLWTHVPLQGLYGYSLEMPSRWYVPQTMRTSSNHGHASACTSYGNSNQGTPQHINPYRGRPQKPYEKRKEKHHVLEFFSSNKSCCYTKPVQIFYIHLRFYLLHLSKAHRISSVKMAGYFWGKKILKYYSYPNYCLFVLAFCWSRAGMLWRDWEAGISEAFCAAERPLAMESVFWARCLAHVFLLSCFNFR